MNSAGSGLIDLETFGSAANCGRANRIDPFLKGMNIRLRQRMRILLVANYEPDAQASMRRYAAWVKRMLLERGYEVTVIKPKPIFSRMIRHSGLGKYLGYVDKYLLFPSHLWKMARKYDLVHVLDHSYSMYLRMVKGKPNLITCHDVLAIRAALNEFPESAPGWSGKLLQHWILLGLRSARNVICVSSATATGLKLLTGEAGALVRVVHNPLNWNYRPNPKFPSDLLSRLRLNPNQPYFLHVGGNAWYKNRRGVLRIFACLSTKNQFSEARLLMVGRPLNGELRSIIKQQGIGERVIEVVDPTNEELQALYSNAVALIFPSLLEGFGWPMIEAQACGCPVVASCYEPMPEVAGDGAIYIDPTDPEGSAAAIVVGLEHRDSLRDKSFQNLERFDEELIASQYCALYEEIMQNENLKRRLKTSSLQ